MIAQENVSRLINWQPPLLKSCCKKAGPQFSCPNNWRVSPSLKYCMDNAAAGRSVQLRSPAAPVAWSGDEQFSSVKKLTCQAWAWETTAAMIKAENFMVVTCARCVLYAW